jgi:[acyl-carrier-protein] S-malonyltransferase
LTVALGVLCPGQGSQHPGMLDLLAGDAVAEASLQRAGEALGQDLREWLQPPADLHRNRIAQPLLCVAELATWEALRNRLPPPRVFAGYSVGELAAYGCAGAIDAAGLAHLARRRALLMDSASEVSSGLLAVRGLDRAQVAALCGRSRAEIAIIIGADRFVLGAATADLAALGHAAEALGATTRPLPVSVASHTSRLVLASEGFRAALAGSALGAPAVPVLAGISGLPVHTRAQALDALARQISTCLNWAACLEALPEMGCRVVLELGPGNALARMVRDRWPALPARSAAEFRSLQGVADWVAKWL